jgi:protein phosphatase
LTAVIRVANNLIADRNNTQGRESRRRMGTTLVMAIQLPQKVKTPSGLRNTHELYLAHVGDSRAYWLTPDYCHPLTVDDDVATREVSLGRSLYHEALQRPDAGALTQALGTRDAQLLRPTVRRFVLEENGLLLLCSDGLSDHDWVERAWPYTTRKVLQGEMTLAEGVQAWIDLANQHNGHDNTSVVLLRCLVTGSPDGLSTSFSTASSSLPTVRGTEPSQSALATDSTTSTKKLDQLLMGPASAPSQAVASRDKSSWSTSRLASIVGVVLAIAVGLVLWQWRTIQQTWRSLFPVDASDAVFPPAAGAASVRASVTADEDVKP